MLQEFVQQIKNTVGESLNEVHTAMPGRIVSVDAASGTATVQPMVRLKKATGDTMDYPPLQGVPIVLPQGYSQAASIVFPVCPGDGCLIIISEQALDYWQSGAETNTDLKYDLTNAVCIPGLFTSAPDTFAEACTSGAVIISAGSNTLKASSGGITVLGNLTVSGKVSVSGSISASGSVTGSNI